ncbi:MAG: hypothetical protein OEM97_01140 [Acidimicrobiia bacterium]|nr:hypothetical protein [Acidimicrobiia bacterium]
MLLVKKVLKYSLAVDVLILVAAAIARIFVTSEGQEDSNEFSRIAILGSDKFASRAISLRRGSAVTVMGGLDLDLRGASIVPGAELTILTLCGAATVRVPAKWKVIHDAGAILGDARFVLDSQDDLSPDAPAISINVRSIMGGTVVTNRPEFPTGPD